MSIIFPGRWTNNTSVELWKNTCNCFVSFIYIIHATFIRTIANFASTVLWTKHDSTVDLPSDLQQIDEYLPSYLISGRRRTVLIRTSTLFLGFVVLSGVATLVAIFSLHGFLFLHFRSSPKLRDYCKVLTFTRFCRRRWKDVLAVHVCFYNSPLMYTSSHAVFLKARANASSIEHISQCSYTGFNYNLFNLYEINCNSRFRLFGTTPTKT